MGAPSGRPVLERSAREARLALGVWAAAFVYTIVYCAPNAYGRTAESLTFILGFPDWVFWGILAPWSTCVAISAAFAFFTMEDEDLGPDRDDAPPGGGA